MNNLIPASIKEMVQAGQMDPTLFLESVMRYCHIIGFGKYEYIDWHLLSVGIAQGLFEMVLDVESTVEWELSEEGNLRVEVKPQAFMTTV